ncbi:helix-turn-helix transcriptional regulator [Gorillibacterium sp. sgz500922]|uniref:helix-turn-helix transcriptional regulator n=1 Tax=Gorillibacterium sp. sgz500922 TaxID=3446694 RepID=UPI003F67DA12
MNQEEFIQRIDEKVKLVRTEYGYSQDRMAELLGMSKKTLVQIEKGRSSLGWMGAVALCSLFGRSEILSMSFGGPPVDIVMALAFGETERHYPKTMGGKVWWTDVSKEGHFKIQKNMISQHFRLLDGGNRRICSSFDYESVKVRLNELLSPDSDRG